VLCVRERERAVGVVGNGVVVIAATNCPEQIDAAALRRFSRLIYVPLPDAEARADMLRVCVRGARHALTDDDVRALALETELRALCWLLLVAHVDACASLCRGYSFADIERAVVNMLMLPIRCA
jgi:SpoVK/Ycf46/Vps4 family AAA+-type ATPase